MCYLSVSRREPMPRDRKSQWSTWRNRPDRSLNHRTSTTAVGTTTSGLISFASLRFKEDTRQPSI
jgi:hypothetical protein